VRTWHPVRAPLQGDIEQIRVWLEVCTGFELTDDGALHALDAATWSERRGLLKSLGGPPRDE